MDIIGTSIMVLLVWVAIFAVIFFITRAFWLWYFQLDKIERHLATLSGNRSEKPLACGKCKREISATFIACPYCAQRTFRHCADCKKKLDQEFKLCPYCGSRNINAAADVAGMPAASDDMSRKAA